MVFCRYRDDFHEIHFFFSSLFLFLWISLNVMKMIIVAGDLLPNAKRISSYFSFFIWLECISENSKMIMINWFIFYLLWQWQKLLPSFFLMINIIKFGIHVAHIFNWRIKGFFSNIIIKTGINERKKAKVCS